MASPLFETAVDAVVAGDLPALQTLLDEHPELATLRSEREHHSTLLHYISANGVENERQHTPPNIVTIARLLLDCGADVNAESAAYGGKSTALALTATSCHPEAAGVQLALLELLIAHGATFDDVVNPCLQNGRGAAAEYLANRGARLDLEGASGVGRLDLVKNLFSIADAKIRRAAFAWACQFGRTTVVEYFLDQGMSPAEKLPHHQQTGLHWAAYGGYADTVQLLIERGAPLHVKDAEYDGTALDWALHQWQGQERYYPVVARLARAGLTTPYTGKAENDPRMLAALRGEDS
jgi:hypothetical protein